MIKRIQPQGIQKLGNVFVPENAVKKVSAEGEVVAVGAGCTKLKGEPILKQGDRVLLPDYKGQFLTFEGEEYETYKEDEIIAIIRQ